MLLFIEDDILLLEYLFRIFKPRQILHTKGFTWSNRRNGSYLTKRRLDRVIWNQAWLD